MPEVSQATRGMRLGLIATNQSGLPVSVESVRACVHAEAFADNSAANEYQR